MLLPLSAVVLLCLSFTVPAWCQVSYPGTSPLPVFKVIKYADEYLRTSGGTCNYGNVYGLAGIVLAPNTAMYSDMPTQFVSHPSQTKGDGCGICYNVTGPAGSTVAIAADICDACEENPSEGPVFLLYDNHSSDRQVWDEVAGVAYGGGSLLSGVTYQKVSCPLNYFANQDIGLRWALWNCCNNPNPSNGVMEWTVTNHRVQVTKFEVMNQAGGTWVELQRSWTNKFSAPYEPESGNLKWWVFNQDYRIRITGTTGTVEFTLNPQLMIDTYTSQQVTTLPTNNGLGEPQEPRRGVYVATGIQFPDFEGSTSTTATSTSTAGTTTTSNPGTATSTDSNSGTGATESGGDETSGVGSLGVGTMAAICYSLLVLFM